jgi:hypothetical protein
MNTVHIGRLFGFASLFLPVLLANSFAVGATPDDARGSAAEGVDTGRTRQEVPDFQGRLSETGTGEPPRGPGYAHRLWVLAEKAHLPAALSAGTAALVLFVSILLCRVLLKYAIQISPCIVLMVIGEFLSTFGLMRSSLLAIALGVILITVGHCIWIFAEALSTLFRVARLVRKHFRHSTGRPFAANEAVTQSKAVARKEGDVNG